MHKRFFGSLCLGLSLSCLVTQPARADSETRTVHRTSVLIGSSLQLEGGSAYGKVEDFVLSDGGCIEYLVVAVDDGYVVVPWGAATVNFDQRVIRVDVTRERLQELRFQKSEWASVGAAAYHQRVERVFGARANRENRSSREGETNVPREKPRTEQPKPQNTEERRQPAEKPATPPNNQPNTTPKPEERRQPAENPATQPKREDAPRQPKAEEPRRPAEQPPAQPKREEAPRPNSPRQPQ